MADNKSSGLFGGLIIGGAIGAIAGILAAPRTGRETRHILKKSADALPELAEDLATSIQFQADRLSDTSLQNWEQTLGRLREAIAAGRAASRQEWQRQAEGYTEGFPEPVSSSVASTLNDLKEETSESPRDASAPIRSDNGNSTRNGSATGADEQSRL